MNSPCVARCGLNNDDYCMGCYRHVEEIVAWSNLDDSQKRDIVAKLDERRQQFVGQDNNQILSRDKWLEAQLKLK
ncbi:DUF1289 domain-containing protein [Parashewanella spongiae]|uniref:DUF1289 domain-containing protein n=1 Tax=Parashewanella spongiae TaxID=342950 RepID=A0A3A6U5C2_9GAMM|nr:DUF1289 domain-containing protein [Parashewanella spongiae]MCL1079982.1 DUF1289 domain-containing protein [Parashewanella spongiae]RJY19411.1 DUF1289 domain-containing protein [Parashewanella spongiae]